MKKLLRVLCALALIGGLLTILASTVGMSQFAGRAQRMQVVKVDRAAADLFGDATPVAIGEPQMMIVEEPSVFLADKTPLPEGTPAGTRLLDEAKLKETGTYPLQLKTVEYVGGLVRMGGFVSAVVGLIGLAWLRRRG